MFQARELAQCLQHGCLWQAGSSTQCQCGQRIELVVLTTNFQLIHCQQVFIAAGQLAIAQTEFVLCSRSRQAKTQHLTFNAFRLCCHIITVDHCPIGIAIHLQLYLGVMLQITIAVQVVGTDIQAGGNLGLQMADGFQLEAGQFEHVQLDFITQQVQHRRADIAANSYL